MELLGGWTELLARSQDAPAARSVHPAPMDVPRAAREVRVASSIDEAGALARDVAATPLSALAFSLERGGTALGIAAWSVGGEVLPAVVDLRQEGVAGEVAAILGLRVPLVFHDAKPVLLALWRLGIDPDLPNLFDTYLAAGCLSLGAHHRRAKGSLRPFEEQELADEREHSLTLEAQCSAHELSLPIPPAATGAIADVEPRMLAARACWTLHLYLAQQAGLLRHGLHAHLHTVEFPYAVANARMEARGVHMDPARRQQVLDACAGAERRQTEFLEAMGIRPPGSPEAFLSAMDRLGHGQHFAGRSLDDGSLRKLEGLHPAVRAFRLYRRYRQQAGQIGNAVVAIDGRVHPEHRQLAAATGRSSCRAPALAGLDRVLRPVVTAPPGRALIELDFAQVEVGVAAAELADQDLVAAYNQGDVYAAMAQRFYQDELSEEERALDSREFRKRHPEMREAMKPFVLALLYGSRAEGVAARFGISVAEARRRIARFMLAFPGLVQKLEDSADFGLARGHASIISGLRRQVDRDAPREWTKRFLRNTPIQGGAAVVFKRAVVDLDREFRGSDVWLVLPIYDAVLIECPVDQVDEVVSRAVPIMEHALRTYYPALRPRVEVNRAHLECWNKDGHADSLDRFLADPTFSLDRLDQKQSGFPWEEAAPVSGDLERARALFVEKLRAAWGESPFPASESLDEWFERYQERAAIREYDGGYERAEAERLALEDVLGEVRVAS